MTRRARALLEPGTLLSGVLFQDFLRSGDGEALAPGTRLGAFRVVRELGRGGMGVVHLGERDDGEFQQQVALKSMVDRGSETGGQLFRRERQILAGLRHPNIARLLDGGRTDAGLLWFAMEWVDGERIDLHCARHALPLEQRLAAWMQVADAVQFAHARLLIHRDIKPGNVLVDADGRPRLLDFGIATLAGDNERQRAYSPGHASPEQRAGEEVGIASDQYQLGRLLLRMLAAGPSSSRATTRSEPVASLATHFVGDDLLLIDPALAVSPVRRRELTAILARACAHDPAARYASVAAFRSDIGRLLAQEPVEALGGGWRYAFGCALRRHPRTAMAGLLTASTVAALIVFFSLRLAAERDAARAEAAKAQAINAFVNEDLLRSADPYEGHAPDLSVREALDRARERLGERFSNQPEIEAALRATLGWSYAGLAEYVAAIDELGRALALRSDIEFPTAPESRRLRIELAHNLVSAGRYTEAEPALRAFLDEVAPLAGAHEDQFHAQVTLAELLGFVGRSAEALALYDETEPMAARLGPRHALVAYRDDARAHLLLLLGRPAEALSSFDSIVARSTGMDVADASRRRRAEEGRARALRDLERYDESIALFRALYAECVAKFGNEHRESLRNHNELAVALSRSGQREEAIAIWRDDFAIRERRLGANHPSTLVTRYNLANELAVAGQHREAEHAFRAVLEAERTTLGAQDPGTLTTQISLAEAVGRQPGRAREALALLDEAHGLGRTTLDGRPQAAVLELVRSRQLDSLGRRAEALVVAREAEKALVLALGAGHRRASEARQWRAELEHAASAP